MHRSDVPTFVVWTRHTFEFSARGVDCRFVVALLDYRMVEVVDTLRVGLVAIESGAELHVAHVGHYTLTDERNTYKPSGWTENRQ